MPCSCISLFKETKRLQCKNDAYSIYYRKIYATFKNVESNDESIMSYQCLIDIIYCAIENTLDFSSLLGKVRSMSV